MSRLPSNPSTQRGVAAEPRAVNKARSRFIVPVAVSLSIAIGLLVGLARPLDSARPVAKPPVNAEMAVARRFYSAINAAIVDGDTSQLDGLVAADFADHAPRTESVGNRADLDRIVRDLAATIPSLRLTPVDVIADNDRVVIRLQIEGALDQTFLGIPIEGARPWSEVEILRVAHGKIAERWPASETTAPPQELADTAIDVRPPARRVTSLKRLTISEGAADFHFQAVGPGVFLVEHGFLVATIDPESTSLASLIRASTTGQPGMIETVKPGRRVTIGPGDLIVFEAGARYVLANEGSTGVDGLLLAAFVPADPGGAPMVTPTPLAGVSFSQLAQGTATLLPLGADDVAIGRVTLAPATALAPHTADGLELVVVESGGIRLSSEGDSPWFRSGVDGSGHPLANGPLVAGDSVLVPGGTTVDYRNIDQTPAVLLVVRLTLGLATPVASASS